MAVILGWAVGPLVAGLAMARRSKVIMAHITIRALYHDRHLL